MLQNIQSLGFLDFSIDQEKSYMYLLWNEKSASISEEAYKNSGQMFKNLYEQYKFPSVLHNLVNFKYAISPELQDYISNEVMTPIVGMGLKKMAIILPEEIFSSVSVTQTIEEVEEKASNNEFVAQYFDDEENGKIWLNVL